ncbi:unnamed protein product [Cochlearia groenlandica]
MEAEKIGVEQRITTPPHDSRSIVEKKIQQTESPPVVNPSSNRLVYVRRRVDVDNGTVKTKEPTTTTTSIAPSSPLSNERLLEWEERYHNLQMLLNKLNDSSHHHHSQMLWSLSSEELSKHAVALEKRSIQFSLEEAREMQRVAALNVLGKSVNSLKPTPNDGQ